MEMVQYDYQAFHVDFHLLPKINAKLTLQFMFANLPENRFLESVYHCYEHSFS